MVRTIRMTLNEGSEQAWTAAAPAAIAAVSAIDGLDSYDSYRLDDGSWLEVLVWSDASLANPGQAAAGDIAEVKKYWANIATAEVSDGVLHARNGVVATA